MEESVILSRKGIELNLNKLELSEKEIKYIRNKFTLRYKDHATQFVKILKNYEYKKKENKIIIPRFGYKNLKKNKKISEIIKRAKFIINEGEEIECEYKGKSKDNQEIVVNHIIKEIFTKPKYSGCTIKLTAGTGKSYVALDIISKVKKKTMIIVPNEFLLKQWVLLLENLYPKNKIGMYYGKKKIEGDIVVSIINSAITDEFKFKYKKTKLTKKYEENYTYEEYYKKFGLIIYDESHGYCTKKFKKIFNRAQAKYVIGLSATPESRNDGFDSVAHLALGPILEGEELEGYNKDTTKFESDVKIIKYNGPDEYTKTILNEKTEMICVPLMLGNIIEDPYRNQMIIEEIILLYNKRLNIFVFSDRRLHLEHLYKLLSKRLLKLEIENYEKNLSIPELDQNSKIILYGGSNDEDINKATNQSNVIFTTYQYSSTGISINKMTGLVLATPRRSKTTQTIGRIFRLADEYKEIKRHIIDIVDYSTVLKNQLTKRKKSYLERESNIETEIQNYEDIKLY